METKINSKALKAEALRLGFSACGIAPAGPVDPVHQDFLKEWLGSGRHAGMAYMANHFDKRCDPALLVEGTRCVVSVALNYYPATRLPEDEYQFAWYAYGMDYHDLMREKLTALFRFIQESDVPELDGRVFCDTAPVPERYWAWRAGLGWIGKNTQLIIPHAGSAFFLGELFLNTEADTYDRPRPNRCGTCNRCLQACPTQALEAPYGLDARRCLSYLTIENKGEIPASISPLMGNRVYGCDECQKACPWNRFATPCRTPELQPSPEFMNMKKEDWQQLSEEKYRTLFKGSAVKRAKYSGLIRNIKQMKD
ncbi:tRNA epoxyqueuosine(34) reductase QueG [Bacteroides fragilis]|uniref:tRNA epoxyqueuosine(34) reductase QueG n=1 Tax=Bacteroides fragilis TaxID=817 RepID=UPI001C735F89|nr:tRNA epoxyqueuosine(34) reductase QueG [Bacteroides fragilis]